jgi:ribonuclease P protein component
MLAKNHRVNTKLFDALMQKGRFAHSDLFMARFSFDKTLDESQFSSVVPVKVARKANKRNYLRRRMNAALRLIYPSIKPGYACIVFAKKGAMEKISFETIVEDVRKVLGKAGIV